MTVAAAMVVVRAKARAIATNIFFHAHPPTSIDIAIEATTC
jgi:hypothetical protein